MKPSIQRGVFVTGTDTGVGKTFVVIGLIQQLELRGITTAPRKPVESGCKISGNEVLPADALVMQGATSRGISLDEICPHRLEHALSPERAAALEGVTLSVRMLAEACQGTHGHHHLIVEGAGGFYSPVASDGLNADLAQRLGLPVLLVASDRLGCINQVLLTAQAIESRGLTLSAVALNQLEDQGTRGMDNAADLRCRMDCPIIVINRGEQGPETIGMTQLADAILQSQKP
jgi:dethiobiotin synthetase